MSPTIQRLAVGLETAVYGWTRLVADRARNDDASDHDPLASPLTLPISAEPVLPDALPQAS